jgi:hypothetical protein
MQRPFNVFMAVTDVTSKRQVSVVHSYKWPQYYAKL